MVPGHLRDVDEALDPVAHLDEGTEGHQLGDAPVDQLAHLVRVGELLPRVGLGGLEREADPLLGEIDVEDLDVDLVTDGHDRGRVVDVLPRQLGHVDESVHAAEVDEGTEIDDRGHHAATTLAGLEVDEELAPLLLLRLLEPGPAGQHDVVAVAVQLDDLGLDGAAHVGLQLTDPAKFDEARRQEAAQPDVDDEPALDDLDDRAGDDLVGLLELLDGAPGPLVLGPLLREDEATLLVLLLEDKGLDGLAERDDLGGVHVVADGQLADGDDALGLEPDVEEDLVAVDLDHGALDEVTVLELDDGAGHGVFEGASAKVVLGDGAGDVHPVLVEVAHGLGGQQVGAGGHDVGIGHQVGSSLSGRVRPDDRWTGGRTIKTAAATVVAGQRYYRTGRAQPQGAAGAG